MAKCYLGIDVGSVSTNIVVLDEEYEVLVDLYLRTGGQPLQAVQGGLRQIRTQLSDVEVVAVGTTGSGRQISGVMVGADVIKNEITAHAVASQFMVPDAIALEIGGRTQNQYPEGRRGSGLCREQRCAAVWVRSWIARLVGWECRSRSLDDLLAPGKSGADCRRCAVFAESDMIKQQTGHSIEDITRTVPSPGQKLSE